MASFHTFLIKQANGDEALDEEESFFDLVTRFQSKRMDDQRCSLAVIGNKETQQLAGSAAAQSASVQGSPFSNDASRAQSLRYANFISETDAESPARLKEDLLDLIAGMQSRRMDEQRASLPRLPGLNNADPDILRRLSSEPSAEEAVALPDENFFEMLMRCQVNEKPIQSRPISR